MPLRLIVDKFSRTRFEPYGFTENPEIPRASSIMDYLFRWLGAKFVKREQVSILPPSLELQRKVETELAAIEKLPDEATVRRRIEALNVEIAKLNATVVEGPPTRLSTLDVDRVVARWRQSRLAKAR